MHNAPGKASLFESWMIYYTSISPMPFDLIPLRAACLPLDCYASINILTESPPLYKLTTLRHT